MVCKTFHLLLLIKVKSKNVAQREGHMALCTETPNQPTSHPCAARAGLGGSPTGPRMGRSLPLEPAQSPSLFQRRFLRGKTREQLSGAPGTRLFSQIYSSDHTRREQSVSLG